MDAAARNPLLCRYTLATYLPNRATFAIHTAILLKSSPYTWPPHLLQRRSTWFSFLAVVVAIVNDICHCYKQYIPKTERDSPCGGGTCYSAVLCVEGPSIFLPFRAIQSISIPTADDWEESGKVQEILSAEDWQRNSHNIERQSVLSVVLKTTIKTMLARK